jgi:hypothetical protein
MTPKLFLHTPTCESSSISVSESSSVKKYYWYFSLICVLFPYIELE